ncbi:MAG: hypothetical protein IJQ17_05400 [Oscillospiraceae bacterium]|nr:hypothetical protein [Oscillospiraceae bacterium]
MKATAFIRGMAIGMVAGVALDMVAPAIGGRKTTVGKAMQKVGNAVDTAIDDVSDRLR